MARAGKITIYVDTSVHNEVIAVRTTGKIGETQLNTVTKDIELPFRTSAPDARTFWLSILAAVSSNL